MSAFSARSVYFDGFSMPDNSHIANVCASPDIRKIGNAFQNPYSHNAEMDGDDDKNGGPNHLRAWMLYRKINGAELAGLLGVTPGMVSDLVNSKRALSAKWLRRIAPHLKTTPGLLLDHDPRALDNNVVEMWVNSGPEDRRRIVMVAKAAVSMGTDG